MRKAIATLRRLSLDLIQQKRTQLAESAKVKEMTSSSEEETPHAKDILTLLSMWYPVLCPSMLSRCMQ